jgi:hypothetical protein
MSIENELSKARQEYELAIQQESNAVGEFIDIAIANTNAATIRLDTIVKRAKLAGYNNNRIMV